MPEKQFPEKSYKPPKNVVFVITFSKVYIGKLPHFEMSAK
jgi:hypothetical protein